MSCFVFDDLVVDLVDEGDCIVFVVENFVVLVEIVVYVGL